MSIDTRFMPAIRNALLEKMQDAASEYAPGESSREPASEVRTGGVITDRISISADALRISAATNTTAGQDVFDAGRVAEIRQAIAGGLYGIDPVRIADSLLRLNNSL